jgi:hypothetical protein
MARRLLIVDHYDGPAFERAAAASGPGDEWDVFLLGGSPEWFRWRHPRQAGRLPGARLLDAGPFAARAHAEVNGFVVDLGARLPWMNLGNQTLAALLAEPGGTAWWYLETSEKGPYRGPLIGQLYLVAIAGLVARDRDYDDVWFSFRERQLAAVMPSQWVSIDPAHGERDPRLEQNPLLRLCLTAARAFVWFVSARLFCYTLPGAPDPGLAQSGRWVFTVFPSWWTRVTTPAPADRFFTNIGDARFDGYFGWLTESRQLWRNRQAVRTAVRDLRIVPLQQFLSLRDGLGVFSPRRFWRLWRFQRTLRPHLRLELAGLPVGPLVARDIARSLSAHEPLQDALVARAMARAADRFRPRLVLYRAEFQPIENAVLRGLAGKAAAVGFQHHPFGENYLSMRFTAGEMAQYLRVPPSPDARPLPTGVVAIGPVLAEHVVRGGLPASRVAVCGPQRYGALIRYRQQQRLRATLRQRLEMRVEGLIVFVALAIVESDTEALFGALVAACEDVDLRIVVRTHPNRPQGDPALHATLDALGRSRAALMPSSGGMYDYIAAADCMVCIGSMIAFEAIALGIMPIVFDNPATFGAVSLAEYAEGLFVVRNADELRAAIDDVMHDSERAQLKRRAWPALLARVMGDLDRSLGEQMDEALDVFDQPTVVSESR